MEWLKENKFKALAFGSAAIVAGGLLYSYTQSDESTESSVVDSSAQDVSKVTGKIETKVPEPPMPDPTAKKQSSEAQALARGTAMPDGTAQSGREEKADAAPVKTAAVGNTSTVAQSDAKLNPSRTASSLTKASILSILKEINEASIEGVFEALANLKKKYSLSETTGLKEMMKSKPMVAKEFQMALMSSQQTFSTEVLGKYGLDPMTLNQAMMKFQDDPDFMNAMMESQMQTQLRLRNAGIC